jgi:hypothetical protein
VSCERDRDVATLGPEVAADPGLCDAATASVTMAAAASNMAVLTGALIITMGTTLRNR